MHDYYPVESRVSNIDEYSKEDPDEYTTVGWIRVQGTNIDYPVIYAPRYDLGYKTDNFAWNEVNSDHLLNKVSINGHNIMNLSSNPLVADKNHTRFEQLMSFVYLDFVEENKYIQYTFDGVDYIYKIFAVSFPEYGETDTFLDHDLSSSEMKDYIEQSLEDSIFEFNIDVDENDKIISLVTCTRMFQLAGEYREFRVDARLVRENELKTNYGVKRTDKYKELDSVMKGGEYNEEA